jgi:hypothetical protein
MFPVSRAELRTISDINSITRYATISYFVQKIYNDVLLAAGRGEYTYNCSIQLDNSMMEREPAQVPENCVPDVLVRLRILFPGISIYSLTNRTPPILIIDWSTA